MIAARIHIELLGFWHPGTGRGQGPGADAVANRSASGLPYLPGRTLKGLLREGARIAAEAGALRPEEVDAAFGANPGGDAKEAGRFRTRPGSLRFESARIGSTPEEAVAWEEWATASENAPAVRQLFRSFASTKLDEAGRAEDGTLRTVEVVVPTHLLASVSASDRALALRVLRASAPHVLAVGAHRTRGLGRCVLTVEEVR